MNVSIESIERLAALEKEDWQRKVNQGVLKTELNQSISALGAMDALDRFLYILQQEAKREEIRESESKKVERRISNLSLIRRKAGAR